MGNFTDQLASAQNGDRPSLEAIIADFGWVVDSECYKYLSNFGSDISVSDLKQEVWVRIWGHIDQFQYSDPQYAQGQFVAWLRTVSKRVVLSLDRKARNQTRSPRHGLASLDDARHDMPTRDDAASPSSVVAGIEEANRLRKAVHSLSSDEMKSVIRYCFFEGLNLSQVADRLDLTYDQVRYRFHTALQELERFLNQQSDEL
jgi:RNA polymerase sigma factor (sigma-70 family)